MMMQTADVRRLKNLTMVQTFAANRADYPFDISSLQRSAQTETEGTLESEDR